jgi:hypothetical protein
MTLWAKKKTSFFAKIQLFAISGLCNRPILEKCATATCHFWLILKISLNNYKFIFNQFDN